MDKDWAKGIYGRYEDDELKREYYVFNSVMDVDCLEESLLIEQVDDLYPVLLEEIAKRYIDRIGQKSGIIHLCLNS